ncbi:MAG TPA: O-antigen ligase family protein [Steroidobacteraceae bacterium]|nr:O-antigen ligase family protein [Steroidobacteraceae bacterium]
MPTILGFAALFLLATDALNWDLSLLPGVSAKNLIIYFIAVLLALRMVMSRASIMAAGQMQGAFIVLIGYAIVTWLIAALLIQYPHYSLIASGIQLKSALVDHYIFFLVFLFGVQTAEDAMKVVKGLLLGALLANMVTILDAAGIMSLGFRIREDGRTTGAIGESNQYAAFIILFLPATIAAAVAAHGFRRLFWFGASLVACMTLVMTASRGGFVGLAMMCAAGAYLYRHLISYGRISGWVFGSLILLVLVVSFSQYGNLLAERMIGTSGSIDASTASSGRSDIWATAIATMFEQPITFVTGYGWDAYSSMPFQFSPHNHYLALWFNLGLVGLSFGSYLLFSAIGRARRASLHAAPPLRGQLIAFVLGTVGVCTAVFFVDLHKPWFYFWMYAGLAMRMALCVEKDPIEQPAVTPRPRRPAVRRDPYGWANHGTHS